MKMYTKSHQNIIRKINKGKVFNKKILKKEKIDLQFYYEKDNKRIKKIYKMPSQK